jgi:hypothetical protein
MMHLYRIAGLTLAADMALPGAIPADAAEPDVTVARRPVPESLEAPTLTGPVWQVDERRFLLNLPGIGRFLATDGRRLEMEEAPGTTVEDALPFLLGTGVGALLYQRGALVLHASAVADEGRAYAICGPSGAGKSTLAAALCRAGCDFVSDDVSAVSTDSAEGPRLWPDARQMKLFDATIERLDLGANRRGEVRTGVEKHYVEPPQRSADTAVPLGAIYALREAHAGRPPGIERLSPLDGAQLLLKESYRPRLAMGLNGGDRLLASSLAILKTVPVFILTRPRDLDLLEGTAAELRAHWRGLRG